MHTPTTPALAWAFFWALSCLAQALPAQSLTVTRGDHTILLGQQIASFSASVQGGTPPYQFAWSPPEGLSCHDCQAPSAAPTQTTTYTITVMDAAGDTASTQATVTVMPIPTQMLGVPGGVVCAGASVLLTTDLGNTPENCYLFWYRSESPSSLGANIYIGDTLVVDTQEPGTFYYRVRYICMVPTGHSGFASLPALELMVIPAMQVQVAADATEVCLGTSVSLEAAVVPMAAGCATRWERAPSANGPWETVLGAEASVLAADTDSGGTVYYRAAYDCEAAGCAEVVSEAVAVNTISDFLAGLSIAPVLRCPDDSVALHILPECPQGAYTYQWAPAEGLSCTDCPSPIASPAVTTSYQVTVTDGAANTAVASTTVEVAVRPVVTYLNFESHFFGHLTTVTGFVEGSGSGFRLYPYFGGLVGEILQAGSYGDTMRTGLQYQTGIPCGSFVQIEDVDTGCKVVQQLVSEMNNPPAGLSGVPSLQPPSCAGGNDGAITILWGNSQASYLWSNGDTTTMATGLSTGTYSVTATSPLGCLSTRTMTLGEPTPLTLACTGLTAASPEGAEGVARVEVGGGTVGYTLAWSGPSSGQLALSGPVNAVLTSLPAGTYQVSLTDANGCQSNCLLEVCALGIEVAVVPAVVSGADTTSGSILLEASGGIPPYSYAWSHGPAGSALSDLPPGVYTVEVADSAGCRRTISVAVELENAVRTSTDLAPAAWSLYPNPATGSVQVEMWPASQGLVTAIVVNGQGQAVLRQVLDRHAHIELSHWPAGPYVVRLLDANGNSLGQRLLVVQ